MGLHIPEGYCQVHFVSSLGGGRESIFSMAYDLLDPTPVDLEAAYDAFVTFGGACGWGTSIFFEAVRTETGTGDPSEPIVEEFSGSDVGSGTSPMTPPNTAFLFRKYSAAGGRKNRGRFFVPYVRESLVGEDGVISSGTVSGLTDAATAFVAAVGAALEVEGPVILHTDPLDTPTPMTSVAAMNKVATQRRRLR